MGLSPRMKAKKGRYGAGGLIHTVEILSPVGGFVVVASGSPLAGNVTLRGKALDDLLGDVSSTIVWTSSVDGALGTGANVAAVLTTGGGSPATAHVITATVTISGTPVTDTVNITF